jgi:hypothetical protein
MVMDVIRRIVLTDAGQRRRLGLMFTTSPIGAPIDAPPTHDDPWLVWSLDLPRKPETLSVAELADCHCPDLCDRDHPNE